MTHDDVKELDNSWTIVRGEERDRQWFADCFNEIDDFSPYISSIARYQGPVFVRQPDKQFLACTDGQNQYFDMANIYKFWQDNLRPINVNYATWLKFLAIHESLHIAYSSFSRQHDRDHLLWNIASDIIINYDITTFSHVFNFAPINKLIASDKFLNVDQLSFYDNIANMDSESVYEALKQELPQIIINVCNGAIIGRGRASKTGTPFKVADASSDEKQTNGNVKEDLRRKGKTIEVDVLHTDNEFNRKEAGELPGNIIQKIVASQNMEAFPWKRILDKIVREPILDRGFITRDRRFDEFFLPVPFIEHGMRTLVLAVDSSGSIDDNTLRLFVNHLTQLNESTRQYNNVEVVVCDAKIHKIVSLKEFDPSKDIAGRGGTNFVPVFNKYMNTNRKPDLLIYFTDTQTYEWPSSKPSFPVIWAIGIDDWDAAKVPWGKKLMVY